MRNGDSATTTYTGMIDAAADPLEAVQALRDLAANLKALRGATVLCRVLLGRQLIFIQKNELWKQIERAGSSVQSPGLNPAKPGYTSWYNFLEEGFEPTTGLRRQTAYSAIRLAQSGVLSKLSREELLKFRRLANALELVEAERAGVRITEDLLAQAQEMPIKMFRREPQLARLRAAAPQISVFDEITKFLRTAGRDTKALHHLWEVLQDALTRADRDPGRAIDDIVAAYFAQQHRVESIREAQAS